MSALLEATDLCRHYEVRKGVFGRPDIVKALNGVSFSLEPGRTLAVVGESGCGKSTLARLVTMIEEPTDGQLLIDGRAADPADRALRQTVQIVFQNPYGSLNPRQKIGAILEEPLKVNSSTSARQRREKAKAMMERVGLRPEHYDRFPHMFSGGQRQRIAIARALMLNPKILVLDEPVSALDLSIQAQVLNLLIDLQQEFGLAYLFISHDLSVVKHIADEVMVMYLGLAVEKGDAATVFADPRHPYTQALLSATPVADPSRKQQRVRLEGELPSPLAIPSGCAFHPRCPIAVPNCAVDVPHLRDVAGRLVSCHLA
ncbi:dipeptide ABC transporter ATP-binding protein [Pseudohoeflea coraliihabitans]|uniref:Dipeptide ABC transporter ATP-binding protein n=1 Tax=Pseudohoeflea coraliihabitans TaxID=2860393 RepID=A0ABS6WKU1_9HYPH|nr:dipeptide ABC transporter ATP-binding protein [Pseudohoeflea sp. DP4N28-3]MBW3096557.1 dipeptide ABC transporter ATP-binding protein [Pseudohoeflea sp. DP4N28-3]